MDVAQVGGVAPLNFRERLRVKIVMKERYLSFLLNKAASFLPSASSGIKRTGDAPIYEVLNKDSHFWMNALCSNAAKSPAVEQMGGFSLLIDRHLCCLVR